tara:strand:- start:1271 stop:1801 length:531 start_codon:yes stop_codon:yes gene_type:complete
MELKKICLCLFSSLIIILLSRFLLNRRIKKKQLHKKLIEKKVFEKPFPEPLNKENQKVNIDNWATIETHEGETIKEMIHRTHRKCVVMPDHKPKISVCIQDPQTNKGYIVSLCCSHCLETIQTSLKMNDKIFTIRKLNNMDVLYYKNEPRQIAVPCNPINLETVMKIVGTKTLQSS